MAVRYLRSLTRMAMAGCAASFALALLPISAAETDRSLNLDLPSVTVASAALSDLRPTFSFTGRLRAMQRVDIRPRVSGVLEEIKFKEGADVTAGELLYKIEDDAYRAAVDEIRGSIAAATADMELAEIEVGRQRQLVQRQAAAQSQLDIAEANLGKVRGQLKRLEAQLRRAELQLSYTNITAPFAGITGLTRVDVGAFVEPGTGALTTLTRLDPMTVEFPVATADLLRYRRQSESGNSIAVELELPDGTTYPKRGTINFIDAQVSPGTDTVLVRAVFDNPDRKLLDSALVRVNLKEDRPQLVLSIPQRAIQRDQGGSFVMLVDPQGVVSVRRVQVARSTQGRSVISEGLKEGELVITDGIHKVRPGARVDAVKAEEPLRG